jgi:hypothetical protein
MTQMDKKTTIVTSQDLEDLDSLYRSRSESGWPDQWRSLVEQLRALRRQIEAGSVVQIEGGPVLRSWSAFYEWAHGRYHALEDGYDAWIGNDD